MKPIPLPSDVELSIDQVRRVIAAPNGSLIDDNIRPVEAVVEPVNLGTEEQQVLAIQLTVCIGLEDDDIFKLLEAGHFYLSFIGHVVPFNLRMVL